MTVGQLLLALALLPGAAEAQLRSAPSVLASLERVDGRGVDSTLTLRLAIGVPTGWHIGAPRPGASGLPTQLRWRLPSGWRVVEERWPPARRELAGLDTTFLYSGSLAVFTSLARPHLDKRGDVEAVLSYGICREVCMPGQVTVRYHARE
ncbi:MAG TPA: hypothetical protein VLN49_21575 [Gemmatimonadaceae bacterium]|nr:hypothetical protein [Gemmatimonadaceae bacterium]